MKEVNKSEIDKYLNNGWKLGRPQEFIDRSMKGLINTVWMNNGNKNIKVSRQDVDKFIVDGWIRGRLKNENR